MTAVARKLVIAAVVAIVVFLLLALVLPELAAGLIAVLVFAFLLK